MFLEAVEEWRQAVEELIDAGEDRVVAVCNVRARGKGSGVRVDQRVYNVLTLRDGRIARIEDYSDRSKALKAAGLEE